MAEGDRMDYNHRGATAINYIQIIYILCHSFLCMLGPFFPPLAAVITFCSQSLLPLKTCWQQQQEARPATTFGFQMVVFDSTLENILQVCCWWLVTVFELKYFVHAGDLQVRALRLFMQMDKKSNITKSSCRGNKLAQSTGKSKTLPSNWMFACCIQVYLLLPEPRVSDSTGWLQLIRQACRRKSAPAFESEVPSLPSTHPLRRRTRTRAAARHPSLILQLSQSHNAPHALSQRAKVIRKHETTMSREDCQSPNLCIIVGTTLIRKWARNHWGGETAWTERCTKWYHPLVFVSFVFYCSISQCETFSRMKVGCDCLVVSILPYSGVLAALTCQHTDLWLETSGLHLKMAEMFLMALVVVC